MKNARYHVLRLCSVAAVTTLLAIPSCFAQNEDDLAKKLQNPVADLISVPLQSNWDFDFGPADATRYTLNVQPVIPFSLSEKWNLITRTILPVISTESPVAGGNDKTGLGDVVQSFFLSPKDTVGGWILGGGPVILYPTATDHVLGTEKWGMGPTIVMLRQQSGWTVGLLANHIQSFAGNEDRRAVSATFLQPFVSYTFKTFTTLSLNTETTFDWKTNSWTVPINVAAAQLVKIGPLPVQFSLGARGYAESPHGGPDWGLRFVVTLLFPK